MCYSFISISEFHKVENKQWNPQPQLPKNLGRTWNGLEFFWSCWQTFATWATTTSWSGQSLVQVKCPWLEAPFRKNNFGYYIFSFPANIRVDNSGLLKKKSIHNYFLSRYSSSVLFFSEQGKVLITKMFLMKKKHYQEKFVSLVKVLWGRMHWNIFWSIFLVA